MKLTLKISLAFLLVGITIGSWAQNNPPPGCVIAHTNCMGTSSPTNWGGLTYYSTNICLGGSVTPPTVTSNIMYPPGAALIVYQNTCTNGLWSVLIPVPYTSGPLYWIPPIPGRFSTGGVFSFLATQNGVPSIPQCATVTNNVGGPGFSLTVYVVQGQVKAVDWGSDDCLFYTNNDTFATDGTSQFSRPVWQLSPAVNNPVIQPANQFVELQVTANIIPSDDYSLMGTSPEAGLCFTNTGEHFPWGEDRSVAVTAAVELRTNMVDIVTASINWYVRPTSVSNWCSAGSSGPHTNYVTWASPITVNGNMTQKRINWACVTARGATSVDQAASAIHESLVNDFVLTNNCFDDAWYVLDGNGHPGYDCESLSECMRYGVGALGISGSVAYAYAATNSTPPPSCTAVETRSCPGGIHGTEDLRIIDASGKPNEYEACCVVNSVWYPGGIHGSQSSALEVIRYWLDHGGKQAWRYSDSQGWHTCTNPGPYPVPRP
jgi:hypothetical protein